MTDTTTTVRRIAALQSRLHTHGALSQQEQSERATHLRILEETAPNASLIVERWIEAGRDAVLYVHDSGDVLLWACETDAMDDDGTKALARWLVDAESIEVLAPIASEV